MACMPRLVAFALMLLLLAAGLETVLAGQVPPAASSVWDGVYTDEQRARGEQAYRADCASCHGDALEGAGQTPALADHEFASSWNGMPLADLFDRIQTTMPADRPGQLSRERTADILAFVLKANGFPAGRIELAPGPDALKAIRFETERASK
jgi:mono/diheme cytochrome c family protein